MIKRILSLFDARNKEFYRDTSSLAWNFLFPIVVVFGFAFAFSSGNQNIFKVAVHRDSPSQSEPEFLKTQFIQFVPADDLPSMIGKLERHQVDMVVSLGQPLKYWLNSSSPKSYLLERILRGSGDDGVRAQKQVVEGKEIRYVDWLISGLLAMNMSFSALFGVGYTIVRYRKNGVLKRLKATPIHAYEFLTSQVLSRLILILVTSTMVYVGCTSVIHFRMLGSYFDLFVIMTAGAMCLIALGLLVAARITSEEFAGGVLNLITWPMMFLSGVWFSLEGAH
ncbi:MAG: ABC transporter permease, partial [Burkholderiales bacterium]